MQSEEYLKLAQVEDRMWYFNALHRHMHRALGRHCPNGFRQNKSILDAGCGTGGLLKRLETWQPSWKLYGVDIAELACEFSRKRTTADIRCESITALPFADESFDAVLSADVIYHVDDDQKALAEFFRVLKPGAVAVINVPAYPWLWSYHDDAVDGKRRYYQSELKRKLVAAGFTEVRMTHWNAFLLPLIVLRRKLIPARSGTSDVRMYPWMLEIIFNALMAFEHAWIRRIGMLPCGCSILAVASKPVASEARAKE